jgi:glycosyltransferase involved in cell wall biosynthesis
MNIQKLDMQKPKVIVDVYYLYVAQTGIKTYMLTLCEQIEAQQDNNCSYIISPDFKKVLQRDFFRGRTSKWKNLFFQALYFWRKQIVLPFLSYWYRADIIFSPDILSPILGKGKKISVVHDTFFWDNPEHYQPLWLKYYLFFLRKGIKRNGEIVTVTAFSNERLRALPEFNGIPIHVVHPASGLTRHTPNMPSSRKSRYFLHVGVLEKRKNLGMLIEAFKLLTEEPEYSDMELVLIGQKGPREKLDDSVYLSQRVQELNLVSKVHFRGHVSKEELSQTYREAFAYVFPSLHEGFGLPVLEAFAFGISVIISKQGALIEVAADAALVLEENNATSLYEAMKKLIEEDTLREELILKGRKRLEAFSMEKFFLSLDQLFKNVVDGKSPRQMDQ